MQIGISLKKIILVFQMASEGFLKALIIMQFVISKVAILSFTLRIMRGKKNAWTTNPTYTHLPLKRNLIITHGKNGIWENTSEMSLSKLLMQAIKQTRDTVILQASEETSWKTTQRLQGAHQRSVGTTLWEPVLQEMKLLPLQ